MSALTQIRTEATGAEVIEAIREGLLNRYVLAGEPSSVGPWKVGEEGTRRRLLTFPVGRRFVLDSWERNEYGSTRWRVLVCEPISAGETGQKLPGIRPLVRVLLDVSGVRRAQAFLAWLRPRQGQLDELSHDQWTVIETHYCRASLVRLRAAMRAVKETANVGA